MQQRSVLAGVALAIDEFFMELFLEFLTQQWQLASALLVCVLLLAFHESRRGGQKVTSNQLVAMVNGQQAAVVDLREPAEFRKGHIVDAINIPAAKVTERWAELEALREKPLILVCKLGQHSSAVGKQLIAKGFDKVHRLGGGISEWQASQLPVVKD
ncbi:MAG: rhodanese-like domain-containing protein [Spongiibacteraceae bacterium]